MRLLLPKLLIAGLGVLALPTMARQIMLGPPDPGPEHGFDYWYYGTNGGGYVSIDDTDPNTGTSDFTLGNKTTGSENRADFRSQLFPLHSASGGAEPITISFAYKLPGNVKARDNIAVFFRFFDDTGTNFLGQIPIMLGSSSGDSEMTDYKTMTLTSIRALKNATGIQLPKDARATTADIWVTCNVFQPWTSGDARFANFSVTTLPTPPWVSRHWIISIIVLLIILLLPVLTILAIRKRQMA